MNGEMRNTNFVVHFKEGIFLKISEFRIMKFYSMQYALYDMVMVFWFQTICFSRLTHSLSIW